MNAFYIGESFEYITAEYAKSSRSACRQCKEKIQKQTLRIGLLYDDDHFAASYWYHMNCFHFKPRHMALQGQQLIQKIYGIEDLDPQDCDKVVEYLEQEFKNFIQNKPGKKKAKPSKNVKKQNQKNESPSKKSRSESVKFQFEQKANKKKTKKLKKSKPAPKKFMTSQKTKQYNQYLEDYLKLTINQLKELLSQNNQAKTGTKEELASRCADGKLFGRIPLCSSCGGGKLRFNKENGSYKCPGYMQDTDFIHCNAVFQFDQVSRQPWVES